MNNQHHHQDPSETASVPTLPTLENHEDFTKAIKLALQRRVGMNTEKPEGVNMLLQLLGIVDHAKSMVD